GTLLDAMLERAPHLADHLAATAQADAAFAVAVERWWSSAHGGHPEHTRAWLPLARWVLFAWTARVVFAHAVTRDDAAAATVLEDACDPAAGEARLESVAWKHGAFTLLGPAFAARVLPEATWAHVRSLDAV